MSRVGKKPITIPSGVTVTIGASDMEVKGPKGVLTTPIPAGVSFKQEDGTLVAERSSNDQAAFLHGALDESLERLHAFVPIANDDSGRACRGPLHQH